MGHDISDNCEMLESLAIQNDFLFLGVVPLYHTEYDYWDPLNVPEYPIYAKAHSGRDKKHLSSAVMAHTFGKRLILSLGKLEH